MPDRPQSQLTQLLADASAGDGDALNELLPLVYDEMRRLARRQRRRNFAGETLNTTALVHEAYFKLIGSDGLSFNDRVHFFRVAARAMRQILVDYARSQQAAKRGGRQRPVSLEDAGLLHTPGLISEQRTDEILALDEALDRLAGFDERQSHIVELRYFTGLTIDETAKALGISSATVKREWATARAWLYREMKSS